MHCARKQTTEEIVTQEDSIFASYNQLQKYMDAFKVHYFNISSLKRYNLSHPATMTECELLSVFSPFNIVHIPPGIILLDDLRRLRWVSFGSCQDI